MTVGADQMQRMLVEIARGVAPEDSVLAPLDADGLAMWERLAEDVAAMATAGQVLEIPPETPSLDGYRKGYAPGLRNVP